MLKDYKSYTLLGLLCLNSTIVFANSPDDLFKELDFEMGGCSAQLEQAKQTISSLKLEVKDYQNLTNERDKLNIKVKAYQKLLAVKDAKINQFNSSATYQKNDSSELTSLKKENSHLTGELVIANAELERLQAQNKILLTALANRDKPESVSAVKIQTPTPSSQNQTESQVAGHTLVNIKSCRQLEKVVSCSLNIKSQNVDSELYTKLSKTVFYSGIGNKYTVDDYAVGNVKSKRRYSSSHIEAKLIANIDTEIKLNFNNVEVNTREISKLELPLTIGGEEYRLAFRTISIL